MPPQERDYKGRTYKFLFMLSRFVVWAYFRNVKIIHRTPTSHKGPLLVAANHINMVLDPAMLIATFPHGRPCHFWALARFFKLPIAGQLLKGAGVLPVDTKTHSNAKLFEHTLKCLERGGVIALFPEGTSYTAPKHLPFKDGLSWAAYEYLTQQHMVAPDERATLSIIPVGITYTDKNKWRSDVAIEYGEPITLSTDDLSNFHDQRKDAVKRLTAQVVKGVEKVTINAPDWDTLRAASEARTLVFGDARGIRLEDYVRVSQCLVDLFCLDEENGPLLKLEERSELKERLLAFAKTLQLLQLSTLDIRMYEQNKITKAQAALRLMSMCITLILKLPLFLPGLIVNAPIYLIGKSVASFEIHMESVSQDKVVVSTLLAIPIYGALVYWLWNIMNYNILGLFISILLIPLFARYHMALIDKRYDMAKQVIAAWRIFVALSGVDVAQKQKLEDVVQLRRWCLDHTMSLLADLAQKGDSRAQYLVDYGQPLFDRSKTSNSSS